MLLPEAVICAAVMTFRTQSHDNRKHNKASSQNIQHRGIYIDVALPSGDSINAPEAVNRQVSVIA